VKKLVNREHYEGFLVTIETYRNAYSAAEKQINELRRENTTRLAEVAKLKKKVDSFTNLSRSRSTRFG
jgi:wobble nucleotide-excising tRNase